MSLKAKIIDMVEQGFNNEQIVEATGASYSSVQHTRSAYNESVAPGDRKRSIRSKCTKPRAGTQCRLVYDHLVANPGCGFTELSNATGVDSAICGYVRRRFFGVHGKRHQGIQPQPKAMRDISLDELTP